MSSEIIFTLVYLLFTIFIVYPPTEAIQAGLTLPIIFHKFVGSETESFITYHLKKSILTIAVCSSLPLLYIVNLYLLGFVNELNVLLVGGWFWNIFLTSSFALPILALYQIKQWADDDYFNHPIAQSLRAFNPTNWRDVAKDIDTEFRRIEKICIETSPITKVVVTENWILQVTLFTILAAHQSDTTLTVKEATNYRISHIRLNNANETQYLNIEVKCTTRTTPTTFTIRINATHFKDLQDRVNRTIAILPNVHFHKTVLEQFVDVFKTTIARNPRYETNQELEQCIGCLQVASSVKLQKNCADIVVNNCTNCYCRPMWCTDCMAKWFASRQDKDQQSSWLGSKCSCPMCRATFCILDVSMLSAINAEE